MDDLVRWLTQLRDDSEKAATLPAVESSFFRLPEAARARSLDARAADGHACVRCEQVAKAALIAHTAAGDRWLDVCWEHYGAIRIANEDRMRAREAFW